MSSDKQKKAGPWLNAKQAAEYLVMTRAALYEAIRRGEIPVYRFRKRLLRFRIDELEDLLKKGRIDAPLLEEISDVISSRGDDARLPRRKER